MPIVIHREDGGVSIMADPPDGNVARHIQLWSELQPPGEGYVSHRTLGTSEVLPPRAQRRAWKHDGETIVVDAAKLAQLHDSDAAGAIDGMDRLQFEHLFDLENRMRAQESQPQITRAQYRNALIAKWKTLHP